MPSNDHISLAATRPADPIVLLHDLFAFVAAVQRTPAGLRRDGLLTKAEMLRLNEALLIREDLTGVRSEDGAGRLAFLSFLAREENLVQAREKKLVPTQSSLGWAVRAWRWFSLPSRQQVTELWLRWHDATGWDDLCRVRSLRFQSPGSAQHDPACARRRALAVLARFFPPDTWLPLGDVVRAVRERDPVFLRRPESLRWEIADAVTGRDLASARYWDLVEGALLRYLLTGPLHWLGCVSLGYDGAGALASCALTPLGAHLLGVSETPWSPPAREPLVIQPNFEVVAPFNTDLGALLQLERLAELVQAGPARVYRLSHDSLRAALEAGADMEALLAFLEQASGTSLPQNVAYTLREWAGQYGRVRLEQVTLLRVSEGDAALMQELGATRRIAPLLDEALSPTVSIVAAENVPALAARLREDGHMPRVESEFEEPPPTGRLQLAEREAVPLLAATYVLLDLHERRGKEAAVKDAAALAARLERRLSPTARARAERQAHEWLGELSR